MLERGNLIGRLLMATGVIVIVKSGVDYMVDKAVDTYLKKTKEEAQAFSFHIRKGYRDAKKYDNYKSDFYVNNVNLFSWS